MAATPGRRLPALAEERDKARKSRVTLSLQEDSVRFLHQRQAEVKAPSVSAFVESLIASNRRELEMEALNLQTAAYYDAISAEECAENVAWGKLAEDELLKAEV